MIYLDYAASFPPFPEVLEEFVDTSAAVCGNPGAIHCAGAQARALLQKSRKSLAQLLHVRPEEIFFTSGATEANNWAVKMGALRPGRRHIVCSATEHKSVLASVESLRKSGYQITFLQPDSQGRILPEAAAAAIRPDTALLCVHAVNNETGVVQDVDGLAAAAHGKGALFLCDSVQSFCHIRQNLHRADLISLSAHKLGGPRGIGCLIIRYPHRLPPLLHGGGQEFGLRSGTENLPGIAAFSMAAQMADRQLDQESLRLESLRDMLQTGLRRICPQLLVAGDEAPRAPGILCCAFPGKTGEEMAIRLDLKGICVSPGAACSAGSRDPSHVLLSMGYPPRDASGFIRFSLGHRTTAEEIQKTLQTISDIVS